jgi:hypothetical protein
MRTVSELYDSLLGRGFFVAASEDYMTLLVTPPPGVVLTAVEAEEIRQRKTEILDLFWFSEPVPPCPFPPDAWTKPIPPRLPSSA